MWTKRLTLWRFTLCILLSVSALALTARGDDDVPSESQCRPYIEKALKELESGDTETGSVEKNDSSEVSVDDDTNEVTSKEDEGDTDGDDQSSVEVADEPYVVQGTVNVESLKESDDDSKEDVDDSKSVEGDDDSKEGDDGDSKEADDPAAEQESGEDKDDSKEEKLEDKDDDDNSKEIDDDDDSKEVNQSDEADSKEEAAAADDTTEDDETKEEQTDDDNKSGEDNNKSDDQTQDETPGDDDVDNTDEVQGDDSEDNDKVGEVTSEEGDDGTKEDETENKEDEKVKSEEVEKDDDSKDEKEDDKSDEKDEDAKSEGSNESTDDDDKVLEKSEAADGSEDTAEEGSDEEESHEGDAESDEEGAPEEDLLLTGNIPKNLRSRDHIQHILRLDEEASEDEITIEKSADIVLRDLKRLYENSIKPLEALYKYRDLSNRHFGDPEIFSKPLVLFMGPWSGGKSSIVNYLTGLEFTEWSLRTGAEPSPAYFNILMHGKDPEVLDGTQLAADWTFSGLQKFGQGLEERLRGLKHPSKVLEKVNIVEIPGILEVRKQVSRVFPFNDACQWFIDRADIIFLVYDPSKLDVGPETEAILDQLKGRESQTRIVLNKADIVKPEELMRVQSALIWNISPLMSSAQPPVMYTVSLWSMPYESGAPIRLLQAQEKELFRDLRSAIDKRIENKIASARRFAVRVRNHAKMVDCYLTTYFNHKTIFGNRKIISDAIIENPQNYHIYEGLSTLTNISRYDLPDPETYRDFFRLNPLYEFQQLSATCTYFRGCPITRLDVAIAYDLPELVGKYKKMVETATPQGMPKS